MSYDGYTEEKEVKIIVILWDMMERIESLEEEVKELREAPLDGKEILKALPQGHKSGLDADKLDGEHLAEILKKADQQTHDLVRRLERKFGSVALSVHGNELHNPHYEQYGLSLLLSGIRAMTGDLDLAANNLLTTNLSLKEYSNFQLGVYNRAGDTLKSLVAYSVNCVAIQPYAAADIICSSYYNVAHKIRFRSWNGAPNWSYDLDIINGTIRMATLPNADPADGTSTLWMDPADRIVRVGT